MPKLDRVRRDPGFCTVSASVLVVLKLYHLNLTFFRVIVKVCAVREEQNVRVSEWCLVTLFCHFEELVRLHVSVGEEKAKIEFDRDLGAAVCSYHSQHSKNENHSDFADLR